MFFQTLKADACNIEKSDITQLKKSLYFSILMPDNYVKNEGWFNENSGLKQIVADIQ